MIQKRLIYIVITLFLALSFPMSALADAQSSTPSGSTDPSSTSSDATSPATQDTPQTTSPASSSDPATGPSSPTGPDANTYTYNSATGLWENQYYTWNPVTHQTAPKTPQDYSYNPATGHWDTTQYVYDAPSGTYVPNVVSAPTNPQAAQAANNVITNTGPNSNNTLNTSSNNNSIFNLFYNAKISNDINGSAISGNASVMGNTTAGSALTGNALDVNNIINLLESSFGLQNAADLLTFTENINGDINGDITINPNQINNSSLAVDNSNTQNNLTINSNGSGLINNNITLGANSGNATIADNTNAGNATTGNADAVANIVNIINSAVHANKSFLGVININGNLNGDILLPPNFLDQLLASNAPHATVNLSSNVSNNLTANTTNNETVANDVSLTAASGAANVTGNTTAGSATTGNAGTKLTIFNLTGKQIVSKDNLLVFVNVLGQWVGLIMNAPSGTTAADIGGNVTVNNNVSNNATVNQTTNNTINNNLKVNSKSGDATVANNTTAGNATSGNATASANIANILDSQLSASDWFGLLFINVLGVWHGSFGVNTAAGDVAAGPAASGFGGSGDSSPTNAEVFGFIPKTGSISPAILAGFAGSGASNNADSNSSNNQVILASSTGNHKGGSAPTENVANHSNSTHTNTWILPIASFGTIMLITGGLGYSSEFTDKIYARRLSSRLGKS